MIREAHKQETRDAIIDATERLLDRYGYAKMTMTDLADEAGIGVGTIYLYFPGKVDVALAVLERLVGRVRMRLEEIAYSEAAPTDKIREMLTARIMLRYQAARTRQHQVDEFKRAVQCSVDQHRAGWLEEETQIFATMLQEGRSLGAFEFEDARLTAEALMRATSCLTPKNLTPQDFEHPTEMEKKVGQLIALLMRGVERRDRP